MKDDFLLKRLCGYGLGVVFISAWSLFDLISYEVSMYLSTLSLIYCLFLEAKHCHKAQVYWSRFKYIEAVLLIIGLILLIVFKI